MQRVARGGAVVIAIALGAWATSYFGSTPERALRQRPRDRGLDLASNVRTSSKPSRALAPEAIASAAHGQAAGADILEIERAQAREAGQGSDFMNELPAEDREWVIAQSAAALARGQVDFDELPAYVDQLASVRVFDVIERTAQYMSPEAFR
jgi:hypothetical protein